MKERDRIFRKRYSICSSCPKKRGDRCGMCGCMLTSKLRMYTFRCPLGKFDKEGSIDMSIKKSSGEDK